MHQLLAAWDPNNAGCDTQAHGREAGIGCPVRGLHYQLNRSRFPAAGFEAKSRSEAKSIWRRASRLPSVRRSQAVLLQPTDSDL